MTIARLGPMIEIRFLPQPERAQRIADVLGCVPDYRERALGADLPHGPSHDCLVCADARAALGSLPMEPVLAEAARFMREHDDGIATIGGRRCS